MRLQKDLFHHDGALGAPIVKRHASSTLAQAKRPLVAVASAPTFLAAQASAANDSTTSHQTPFAELPKQLLVMVG